MNARAILAGGACLLATLGCPAKKSEPAPAPAPVAAAAATSPVAALVDIDVARLASFQPLPAIVESNANAINDAKIDLGRMLYFDARLSKNHDVSCNSCHDLAKFGVDGEPTSLGHKKQRGGRNSPSVLNAAGHFVQFWDGRAKDVEEQAKGPVMNPVEMAMPSEARVVQTLSSMPQYVDAFKQAFPDDKEPLSFDNAARAIAAFERKLLTPSRWDRFLKGDKAVLTAEEKAGFNTFVETGCVSCHNGAFVGGGMYQKLGLIKPFPDVTDEGRFAVTKAETDKMMFKVPSLRNIEKTGPYFHTGKVATLDEAVRLMADHQLGKTLTGAQLKSIVVWLRTLTGELDAAYIKKPELPPSTDKTPQPDPA